MDPACSPDLGVSVSPVLPLQKQPSSICKGYGCQGNCHSLRRVVGFAVAFLVFIATAVMAGVSSLCTTRDMPTLRVNTRDQTSARRSTVIVTLCNDNFVDIAADLVRLVRGAGKYDGALVVLFSGTRALHKPDFSNYNVTLKQVSELFPAHLREAPPAPCAKEGDGYRQKRVDRWSSYYAKTAVFSDYFKQWDVVLWMDARNGVYRPLAPFFDEIDSRGKLLANPDNWPGYEDSWKLGGQFFADCDEVLFSRLASRYDLTQNYFQSTTMLFDTALLDATTLTDIAGLFVEYSRITGSDQPIFSIYWDLIRGVYEPLPYRLKSLQTPYDFHRRIEAARYITLAWREGT